MMCPSYNNSTDHGIRMTRSGKGSSKAFQVINQQNSCKSKSKDKNNFNIGTWNIRTMKKDGKLEEVAEQMKIAELDIVEICDTRWAGNGDFINGKLRIIHSGNEKGERNGVAVILRGKWKNNVLNTYHVGDRIMMIKLEAQPTDLYTIQVYFPTKNSRDEEIDRIYEQLEDLVALTEENSNLIIMEDFNTAVGSQISQYTCL